MSHTQRLEYLRAQVRAGKISYGELAELQSLAEHIEPGDTELLEAAGVAEGTAQVVALHRRAKALASNESVTGDDGDTAWSILTYLDAVLIHAEDPNDELASNADEVRDVDVDELDKELTKLEGRA